MVDQSIDMMMSPLPQQKNQINVDIIILYQSQNKSTATTLVLSKRRH